MKTYIQKQTKLTKERVEAKVESGLAHKLEKYCQYLDSDRDYVISQALEIAFHKDKGFGEWLAQQGQTVPDKTPESDEMNTAPDIKRHRRLRAAKESGTATGTPLISDTGSLAR